MPEWQCGMPARLCFDPSYRNGETVAAPWNGLDAAAVGSPFVEDPAQCRNLHVQVDIFDRRLGPYGSHELVPRYKVSRSSDQYAENLKGARADRDRYEFTGSVASAQRAGLPIEPKALEQEEIPPVRASMSLGTPECSNFYRNL
jgi:hypothetical protein